MDLTASIMAITQTRTPTEQGFDGVNLIPSLSGKTRPIERELFWRIVRPTLQQKAVRSGRWKLLIDNRSYLLFDLSTDLAERHDLAAQHPELVRKLKRSIEEWEKSFNPKPVGN